MDKKVYVRPEMVVEELIVESSMLTGSLGINEEGGNEGSLSNDRRGSWGNLWSED